LGRGLNVGFWYGAPQGRWGGVWWRRGQVGGWGKKLGLGHVVSRLMKREGGKIKRKEQHGGPTSKKGEHGGSVDMFEKKSEKKTEEGKKGVV